MYWAQVKKVATWVIVPTICFIWGVITILLYQGSPVLMTLAQGGILTVFSIFFLVVAVMVLAPLYSYVSSFAHGRRSSHKSGVLYALIGAIVGFLCAAVGAVGNFKGVLDVLAVVAFIIASGLAFYAAIMIKEDFINFLAEHYGKKAR